MEESEAHAGAVSEAAPASYANTASATATSVMETTSAAGTTASAISATGTTTSATIAGSATPSGPVITPPAPGAWPLRAVPYDKESMVKDRRSPRNWLIGLTIVTVILAAVGITGLRADGGGFYGFLCFIAFLTGSGAFAQIGEIRRVSTLPRDGMLITSQSIVKAYGMQGLAEIGLATPTISYDDDDNDYTVSRNGFYALWFRPSPVTHAYTLWWRDRDYGYDVNQWVSETVNDRAFHEFPTAENRSSTANHMDRLRRDGADLRMWPCVLEVRGDRARLMFSPNAAKTDYGPLDPRIREGIDSSTFMLADTF